MPAGPQEFVEWFRAVSPYIHNHRGRTFVICFGGEMVLDRGFPSLIHDIALLNSLGIRQVLVYGTRPHRMRAAISSTVERLRHTGSARRCQRPLRGIRSSWSRAAPTAHGQRHRTALKPPHHHRQLAPAPSTIAIPGGGEVDAKPSITVEGHRHLGGYCVARRINLMAMRSPTAATISAPQFIFMVAP